MAQWTNTKEHPHPDWVLTRDVTCTDEKLGVMTSAAIQGVGRTEEIEIGVTSAGTVAGVNVVVTIFPKFTCEPEWVTVWS